MVQTIIYGIGAEEIGIDQGGPFKGESTDLVFFSFLSSSTIVEYYNPRARPHFSNTEFISQLTLLAFSPAFNLFSATSSTHLLYPSLTSITHANHLELFEFVGRVLGKAVYEGVLVEAQFAPFFLAKLLGRHVFLEDLAGLDEELWRNLLFVKRYDGE